MKNLDISFLSAHNDNENGEFLLVDEEEKEKWEEKEKEKKKKKKKKKQMHNHYTTANETRETRKEHCYDGNYKRIQ